MTRDLSFIFVSQFRDDRGARQASAGRERKRAFTLPVPVNPVNKEEPFSLGRVAFRRKGPCRAEINPATPTCRSVRRAPLKKKAMSRAGLQITNPSDARGRS